MFICKAGISRRVRVHHKPYCKPMSLQSLTYSMSYSANCGSRQVAYQPPRRSALASNKPIACPIDGCLRTFYHLPSLCRHKRMFHNLGRKKANWLDLLLAVNVSWQSCWCYFCHYWLLCSNQWLFCIFFHLKTALLCKQHTLLDRFRTVLSIIS